MTENDKPKMASATAAKYDKLPVYRGVLARFPRALLELAKVSQFGAEKHEVPVDDVSYLDIPEAFGVYADAQARHMLARVIEGEVNAGDGDLLHLAQAAWDALAVLEVFLVERGRVHHFREDITLPEDITLCQAQRERR